MNNLIGIIAGDPNSINSEIILKTWKKKKNQKNIFIIGNYSILKKQISKLDLKIPIVKIENLEEIKKQKKLFIFNIPLKFSSIYNVESSEIRKYVLKSLEVGHNFAINKKIIALINAPVDKKIFHNKHLGVTEYLSSKNKTKNQEVMMIHNKELSVVPLTTHIKIKDVTNKINFKLIKTKMTTLNKFYYKLFKKKPRIAILGLNPHNGENKKNSIENTIIKPAVIKIKKLKINIKGPFPADTAFSKNKIANFDVIVGMYHDQVLAPFKALYGYSAINVTLGLKYIRVSPDHGVARDIIGLNKANPQSLINAINFLNKIND